MANPPAVKEASDELNHIRITIRPIKKAFAQLTEIVERKLDGIAKISL